MLICFKLTQLNHLFHHHHSSSFIESLFRFCLSFFLSLFHLIPQCGDSLIRFQASTWTNTVTGDKTAIVQSCRETCVVVSVVHMRCFKHEKLCADPHWEHHVSKEITYWLWCTSVNDSLLFPSQQWAISPCLSCGVV